MQRDYVDAFFADGSIRLSSFAMFRKHPDERWRDEDDGTVPLEMSGEDDWGLKMTTGGPTNTYVLSTSTIESDKAARMPYESAIRITNTTAFAAAISGQIPGYMGGFEGPCIYRRDKTIRKITNIPSYLDMDDKLWLQKYGAAIFENLHDGLFIKARKYAHEGEYRFIWFVDHTCEDYLDIKCPKALSFCERCDADA